jgi:hypothetical protein
MRIPLSILAAGASLFFGISSGVKFVFQWYVYSHNSSAKVNFGLVLLATLSFIVFIIAMTILVYSILSELRESDARKKQGEEEMKKRAKTAQQAKDTPS